MLNIMKAMNYQIRRDNVVIYALLVGIFLPFFNVIIETGFDLDALYGGLFVAQFGTMYPIFLVMVFVILVPRIGGWDLTDKTLNYEIMAGHSRKEVYFGRVILSLVWSMLSGIVIMVLPVMMMTMINGWGENVNVLDVVIRYMLVLFPMFRFICELVLLTFLLRNCYAAMLIGWMFFGVSLIGSMLYVELTEKKLTVQLAVSNMTALFGFENYKLEYIGGEDIPVYSAGLSSSMAGSTILVSLLVGGACLAIGYVVFRKRDMS